MSIYKKLSKMVGYGSLEEKLYALLQTATYKTDLYRTWDLGEGMAVLHKWRNRSIPTQFRTSESTHSVMKMTMEWP